MVEDEDVDGAVEEIFSVHLGARAGGDDIVILVDHVELFAVMLRGRDSGGIEGAGQVDPLRDREIFRAAGGREVLSGAPRGPRCGVGLEQGLQLLAALAEAALHEVVEEDGAVRVPAPSEQADFLRLPMRVRKLDPDDLAGYRLAQLLGMTAGDGGWPRPSRLSRPSRNAPSTCSRSWH